MENKLPKNHTEKCSLCNNRYKQLSSEGLCYSCYCNRHGKPPKEWEPVGKYQKWKPVYQVKQVMN